MFCEKRLGNPELKDYLYSFFCQVVPQNNNIYINFTKYDNGEDLEAALPANDDPNNLIEQNRPEDDVHKNYIWPNDHRFGFGFSEYRAENKKEWLANHREYKKNGGYVVNFIEYFVSVPVLADSFQESVKERLPVKIITPSFNLWSIAVDVPGMVCYRPENSEDMDIIIDRFLQDNNNPQIILV